MASVSARDAAWAALFLLRCRYRAERVLAAVAEKRRNELARALSEFEAFDDEHLKHALADAVKQEDATLSELVMQRLGPGAASASRGIRKFVARAQWP